MENAKTESFTFCPTFLEWRSFVFRFLYFNGLLQFCLAYTAPMLSELECIFKIRVQTFGQALRITLKLR